MIPAADPRWRDALHVTNGDSMLPGLRAAGVEGAILTWRDALHEGPVPAADDDELRRVRAVFLSGALASDLGTLEELTARDRALDTHPGAYVLWFEADLYDQLQIAQILARLARHGVAAERITLICIGEHVGFAHFGGLGELTGEQLRALPATALTSAALEHATAAWAALCADDPAGLREIAAARSAELRFVAGAFDRLGREYPSNRDGLSLTERRVLAAVHDGATSAGAAFVRTGQREARPFLGDTWCYDAMARLAAAPTPLLEADTPVDRHTGLRLTDAGRRVLDGEADHVALNGVERWIGGVHLRGRDVPWRWHEGLEAVVAAC